MLSWRGLPSAEFSCRNAVRFSDDSIEGDQGVLIEVQGLEPVLLNEEEFLGGSFSPGFVEGTFRQLWVEVGRVSYTAMRGRLPRAA